MIYVDVDSFNGFVVSVGSRGIQALQVVHGNATQSAWLGCPKSGAKTSRLAFTQRIAALSAGFDGYKMVYLSAWGRRAGVPKKHKLRDLMSTQLLWYPEPRSLNANLNECHIFGNMESSIKMFRPVICSLFGGSGGVDLQSLTKVSAAIYYGCLVNLGFDYKPHASCCPQRMLSRNQIDVEILSFQVDGPKGEFIEKIEVETLRCDPGIISGLRFTRNWANCYTLSGSFCGCEKYTPLKIAAGTIPTGLYATQANEGFLNMGVISGKVKPW